MILRLTNLLLLTFLAMNCLSKATPVINLKVFRYKTLLVIIAFTTLSIQAQENRIKLKGTVQYDSIYLPDINILNKASKLGTSSNTKGHFSIFAKKGDSILFSSLIFENRVVKITETHLKSKSITVYLEPTFYQLDEIMLDKKILLNSINIAVTKGTILNNDNITNRKAPNARKLTDPNANAGGLNPIALFMALTKKGRLKRTERKFKQEKAKQLKNEFSYTLKNSYGDDFFIDWLHISEENIYLFLDFCEGTGLLKLYDKDEIMIKDFLIKQAKKFNTIQN